MARTCSLPQPSNPPACTSGACVALQAPVQCNRLEARAWYQSQSGTRPQPRLDDLRDLRQPPMVTHPLVRVPRRRAHCTPTRATHSHARAHEHCMFTTMTEHANAHVAF